jgi:hypothetical protein
MIKQTQGFYVAYLRRLADRREAKGDKVVDLDDERYWREREKWHAEATKELPRKAA